MSAEWVAKDEQPILPTSTNPCITRAAGTQGVKVEFNVLVVNQVMVYEDNSPKLQYEDIPIIILRFLTVAFRIQLETHRQKYTFHPLHAMVALWHHIIHIVSLKSFGTVRVHWNLDILVELCQ
jgi:hypothetical protein